MGEKIKDLKPIKVGNSSFMIELNEGYSKDEGRLIHVQNTHFRYLIDEPSFYELSTTILRAKAEKDYYKQNNRNFKKTSEFAEIKQPRKEDIDAMNGFCNVLSNNNIDYRKVESSYFLNTIIVNPKDRKALKQLVNDKKIESLQHPYGEAYGYSFMYQMKAFDLYKYNNSFVEIIYQLPCMSLTPLTWIPLDRYIQELVFSINNENKELNKAAYIIYKISWSVFKDKGFSKSTVKVLKTNKAIYEEDTFKKGMSLVFFKFADKLIEMLKEEKYDAILDTYYDFEGY